MQEQVILWYQSTYKRGLLYPNPYIRGDEKKLEGPIPFEYGDISQRK